MTETANTPANTTPATTAPATTTVSEKPPLPIYVRAEFACSCNRIMTKKEFLKDKAGNFTGEVVLSCPGGDKCQNGGKKIIAQSTLAEAVVGK